MKQHALKQGSQEWLAHRASGYNGAPFFNASDAPAMMGCSPYKTRTQLLHELHTGRAPEVDAATQRRFDDGHRFEALARPLAEEIIGQELYPVVGSDGELSASFDGLTMDESINFEHKSLNDELRTAIPPDDLGVGDSEVGAALPLQYRVQMEQQHMVSGCEKTLFMASKWEGEPGNETLVEERHCWYESDLALRQEIVAGWKQFAIDLAAYVPAEVVMPAVAAPQIGLPAVSIQVNGSIALVDNLDKFGAALTAYVERINKEPETDQDFADLEATVKTLKAAEEALDAAENGALAQTESIDSMRRTVGLYRDTARTNRLLVEKLVKSEKENRRIKIIGDAVAELVAHTAKLTQRLGKPYLPTISGDFQGVVKGLKSIDSMRDKVAGELARCKIEANAKADLIQTNLATLTELAGEHKFLFHDTAQIVLKANDDLTALVKSRIAEHKDEVQRKEDETRERIRAEEQAKAETAARDLLADQQRQFEEQERAETKRLADLNTAAVVEAKATVTHDAVVQVMMPAAVRQAMAPAPKPQTPPAMSLGEISAKLGFNVTSAFLATLGFEATTVKAAKLFHEEDFPAICRAIIEHIESVCEMQAA